jgi:spore coat polysaccharide biosynthesis protein SpsF
MIAAIIQARTGSSRLPGKVLAPIAGAPMLEHVIRRVRGASGCDLVCVATTDRHGDDVLVTLSERCGAHCFRGSENDVLARYVGAARAVNADLVVRITSDCPLYSGALLDEMLAARAELVANCGPVDSYSNVVERTYPRGLDTEIVPTAVLEALAREQKDARAREHVTWALYQPSGGFRLAHHRDPTGADHSALRWTVDTAEDLEFVRAVYDALFEQDPLFAPAAVYQLLKQHPELVAINAHIEQKQS